MLRRAARHLSDLPQPPTDAGADWMFEVRFDYGERTTATPQANWTMRWLYRPDAVLVLSPGFRGAHLPPL